jgi:hypothetical protein
MSTNIFDSSTSICSDNCWTNSKEIHNKEMSDYHLYNTNFEKCTTPDVRMPSMSLDYPNLRGRPGVGLSDDCLIDIYSSLTNNTAAMTRDRCPTQLSTRIFTGGPNLRRGTGDIDKELDVLSGSDTNPFKCNKTIMEQQTYHFTPLLDCMKDIQDPNNIVPDGVRGGVDTRSYINRADFNKNCNWSRNKNISI